MKVWYLGIISGYSLSCACTLNALPLPPNHLINDAMQQIFQDIQQTQSTTPSQQSLVQALYLALILSTNDQESLNALVQQSQSTQIPSITQKTIEKLQNKNNKHRSNNKQFKKKHR